MGSPPTPAGETIRRCPASTCSSNSPSGATGAALSGVILASQAPTYLSITDIIPFRESSETDQSAEPSLAVDPLDPRQMIAGAFANGLNEPYFMSTNGGTAWSDYGTIANIDKSLAWLQDGSAALTVALLNNAISTYSGTIGGSNFGSAINTYNPGHDLDQPWIRTGPSNNVYVPYNDLTDRGSADDGGTGNGETAFVLVSSNGGSTYSAVSVDRFGTTTLQDAPSVRLAVNGNTVYAVFTHWTSTLDTDGSGETRYNSDVVMPTSWFADTTNAPLTLGQERTSADIAIAVDPNNAQHVVVAYGNAPGTTGSGELQLVVVESFDGGQSWSQKFSTPLSSTNRSALPALSFLADGSIGLLYCSYSGSTTSNGTLSQQLLTTTDDFATTNTMLLGTESRLMHRSKQRPSITVPRSKMGMGISVPSDLAVPAYPAFNRRARLAYSRRANRANDSPP
jgi:hypothetical protein